MSRFEYVVECRDLCFPVETWIEAADAVGHFVFKDGADGAQAMLCALGLPRTGGTLMLRDGSSVTITQETYIQNQPKGAVA